MKASRIRLHAAEFGYTKRDRSFWCSINGEPLQTCKWSAPDCFKVSLQQEAEATVSYIGPKPIPSSVAIAEGFRMPRDPKDIVKDPNLAIRSFAQEYYHQYTPDQAKCSSEAVA